MRCRGVGVGVAAVGTAAARAQGTRLAGAGGGVQRGLLDEADLMMNTCPEACVLMDKCWWTCVRDRRPCMVLGSGGGGRRCGIRRRAAPSAACNAGQRQGRGLAKAWEQGRTKAQHGRMQRGQRCRVAGMASDCGWLTALPRHGMALISSQNGPHLQSLCVRARTCACASRVCCVCVVCVVCVLCVCHTHLLGRVGPENQQILKCLLVSIGRLQPTHKPARKPTHKRARKHTRRPARGHRRDLRRSGREGAGHAARRHRHQHTETEPLEPPRRRWAVFSSVKRQKQRERSSDRLQERAPRRAGCTGRHAPPPPWP